MKKLSEYLKENHPEIKVEDFKNNLKAYRNYIHTVRGRYCEICFKEITENDAKAIQPHHFHFTCQDHRQYATHLATWVVRKELGIDVSNEELFDI